MPQSRSEARRKRRSANPKKSAGNVWLERAWRFVARPEFAGVLTLVAGLVALIAPTSAIPEAPSYGWWVAAFRFADANRVVASLTSVATIVALGAVIAQIVPEADETSRRHRRQRGGRVVTVAAWTLMILGGATGLLVWLASQSALPTSRVAVAPGQSIQAFPAIASGRTVKVMLPQQVKIVSVDAANGKAVVELGKAGDENGVLNDIYVGDPLPLQDYSLALMGVESDPRNQSAVLTMTGGIEVLASVGQKLRFSPEGPEFEVRQIVRNYVGRMGPGVQLVQAGQQPFWVFQRDSELEEPMTEFRLLRLESAPVAMFAFSSAPLPGGVPAGGVLFVIGLGLFVLRSTPEDESRGPEEEE